MVGTFFALPSFSGKAVAQPFPSFRMLPRLEAAPSFQEVRRHFRRHRRHRIGRHMEDSDPGESDKKREPETSKDKPPSPVPEATVRPDVNPPAPPPGKEALPKENEQPKPPVKGTETEAPEDAVPYGPPPPPEKWTDAEIQAGQAECNKSLTGLKIVYDKLEPIKQGVCGLPAPIRLKGFESDKLPAVEIDQPPTVTCKLAAALDRWIEEVVQPSAKAHLDAAIVRLTNASAYVCRPRYDDPSQRISQHAYANAIDVGDFITAKGETISVLDHWNAGDERGAFLHEIHDGACEIFGTTLGPEANAAHKNHFHLDMTERRYHELCDFTPKQVAERREAALRAKLVVHSPAAEQDATKANSQAKPIDEPKTAVVPPPVIIPPPKEADPVKSEHKHTRHRRRRYW